MLAVAYADLVFNLGYMKAYVTSLHDVDKAFCTYT